MFPKELRILFRESRRQNRSFKRLQKISQIYFL